MRALLTNVVLSDSAPDRGAPVSGASVLICQPGTTTPITQPIYASATSTVPLSNPVTTDGRGRFAVYADGMGGPATTIASGGGIVSSITTQDFMFPDSSRLPLDLRSYGAKCDGVTDDTVWVQAALDTGHDMAFTYGPGDVGYKITSTLFVGNGTATKQSDTLSQRLIGAGSKVVAAPSPLVSKIEYTLDGYVPILWYGAAGERMMELRGPFQNIQIEGLGFDCRLIASCGIRTYDLQNSTIRQCKVVNHTNCVSSTGDQRTITAAFDIRSYSVGSASPNSLLASNNGGNGCLFENLVAASTSGTRPAGFAVGESDPPAPDGTGLWTVAGGSPDVSQCRFVNCINASANQAGSVGLALRYCDGISFSQCSFPALIPISVEVPASGTVGNGLLAFPNYIVMENVHVDNGRLPPNGSWNDCRIVAPGGGWTAEHKIVFSPAVNALDSAYAASIANFGYGWTTHDATTGYSGLIGNWKIGGNVTANGNAAIGGTATITGLVQTSASIVAGADLRATSGKIGLTANAGINVTLVYSNGALPDDAGVTTVDLGTRLGSVHLINANNGLQGKFFINGALHTVTQDSATITGYTIGNSGANVAIYWDGVDRYRIRNRSGSSIGLTAIFQGVG